jgi:acetolactate synthase small subunit
VSTASAFPPSPASESPPGFVHFIVKAEAHPGLLARVLEQFAKRSLIPDALRCRRVKAYGGGLAIHIRIILDAKVSSHIGRCLLQIPGVVRVAVES